ncbi:CRTAC1 family protein [Gemmata sp. JC673]|uniref:CRTAC1 family protein n=1 Tax=Gemmata algarum TaxID=2975278 RepID=A0ABU5F3A3_9BACT|nr:CRTAC1 family protein [Gemmata algarum]MDY3562056.1 CRTAC1 family protein [Gemmata algarum]
MYAPTPVLRFVALAGAVAVAFVLGACGPRAQESRPAAEPTPAEEPQYNGPAWFKDVTAAAGIRATCRNGEEADQFTILESLGAGAAVFDYDRDGRPDIFIVGGGYFDGPTKTDLKGHPCKLYRNLGNFTFEDATAAAGLELPWWYTHGAAVADYDRDGFPDLVVTGYGRIELFHNEPDGKGGRKFTPVGERLGLRDSSWSTSAGWGDIDGDGFPDLYVCRYVDWSFANNPPCPGQIPGVPRDVCAPQKFKPLVHALFKNEKGQRFRDAAAEHGFTATGCGLGVVLADLNGDGTPDVYVANDASNNFLFFNRGGKLEEKGGPSGTAVDDTGRYNGSMGADVADYDHTGRASIWVTNYQGELHALYHNLGGEVFDHRSRALGVAKVGLHRVGFGTAFVDFDHDGSEDVVLVNGHVIRRPAGSALKQSPVLFQNAESEGRRWFRDISERGGAYFRTPAVARGLAVGDLDGDGKPDLVVTHTNGPVAVLRNEAPTTGPWLGVRLVGRDNRDIVGSTVTVEFENRKLTRFVKGGGSYLSAHDPRVHFGLGTLGPVKRVTVRWSWGGTQSWEAVEPGAYWELTEGQPAAKRLN